MLLFALAALRPRIRASWLSAWDLRSEFVLADELPRYTIEVAGERYTFWRTLRALPALDAFSVEELQRRANTTTREPELLDDWYEDGLSISGTASDRTVFIRLATKGSVSGVDYVVDEDGCLYELGTQRPRPKPLDLRKRILQGLLGLVVLNGLAANFDRPPDVYFYSESSSVVTRRAPDGSMRTETSRSVNSNFRPSEITRLDD